MIYLIPPAPDGVHKKPFIRDERYVKAKGGKKRKAGNLKNREYHTVGYPRLTLHKGQPVYVIWEIKGGDTFEEALIYLEFRLAVFRLSVDYYHRTGKLP